MEISHIIKECQIDPINVLHIKTIVGKKSVEKGLTRWTDNQKILEVRGNNIIKLRKYLHNEKQEQLDELFQTIYINEDIFINTDDNWKNTTSEQIFFEKDGNFSFINQIPEIITFLVFLKVWANPILAILSPLILTIMPYFLLKITYNIDISWRDYQTMLLNMLIGERTITLQSITKLLYFIFSFSQTIIQPFMTRIAVQKLDALIKIRSDKLQACIHSTKDILAIYEKAGLTVPKIPFDTTITSYYSVFAKDKDEGWTTEYLGKVIGDLEVLFRLAQQDIFTRPVWGNRENLLELRDFYDISVREQILQKGLAGQGLPRQGLEQDLLKKSSITFSKDSNHSCLTGPNRGGKSSSLRGILQNVLWAQTYGVAPCRYYASKPFSWIVSSLRVEDRPGETSLFEREVEMAVNILNMAKKENKNGLVLIDEIFHSTNPPDGEKSANIFLRQLWEKKNIVSCVSTHVYSLVENAPINVQKLCSFATKDEKTDKITYSYTLQKGVCKVSSVDEVLVEKKLVI